jgi:hypothetical protein
VIENEGQEAVTGTEALCGGKQKEHTHRQKSPFVRSYTLIHVLSVLLVRIDRHTSPLRNIGFF